MTEFKRKVKNRELLCGTHINLNDPVIANIVAHLDFDYIWIDMEHNYLSPENLVSHMMTIQNAGKPVLVRAPQDDFTFTKKILEMGPDAILFPMIRSVEQAEKLINYTLYPPYGNRGTSRPVPPSSVWERFCDSCILRNIAGISRKDSSNWGP